MTIFRGDILDVAPDSLIIELTGGEEKIDALINLLQPFGIEEIMRSGLLVLGRGAAGGVKTWQK